MFTFQRCGDGLDETWIIHVARRLFRGHKRSWPATFVLGTIRFNGRLADSTFDVWSNYSVGVTLKERDMVAYAKEARRLLESSEMWAALVVAREAYAREEQETGAVEVFIGGVERTRWHTARRAYDYAGERLFAIWQRGVQVTRRAEISRAGFLFAAIEVNAHGHERGAALVPKESTHGSA